MVIYSHDGILQEIKKQWLSHTQNNIDESGKKEKKKHEARHKRVYIVWFHSNEVQKKIKLTSVIEIRTMVAYGRISRIRSDHRIFCIGGNILHFIWVYLIRIHLRILPYINFYPKIKNTIQCLMLIISLFLISITYEPQIKEVHPYFLT